MTSLLVLGTRAFQIVIGFSARRVSVGTFNAFKAIQNPLKLNLTFPTYFLCNVYIFFISMWNLVELTANNWNSCFIPLSTAFIFGMFWKLWSMGYTHLYPKGKVFKILISCTFTHLCLPKIPCDQGPRETRFIYLN